ncbi:hypothetical protein GCM10023169_33830 [Georgenia halophila]|uniref:Uncharacterized protein n=1 Tax=Georgenia halophila TaxID=620889 RepID=A0ABP8LL75_9MICO
MGGDDTAEATAQEAREVAGQHELPLLEDIGQVVDLQRKVGQLYVRYSKGPDADVPEESVDKESGCRLPGLSANPITPEPWWDRPSEQWVARQLCQYDHLSRRRGTVGWLLTGKMVGRGPDCEPLLSDVAALAVISPKCQDQAKDVYEKAFEPGRR